MHSHNFAIANLLGAVFVAAVSSLLFVGSAAPGFA